ncbi:type 1 fimbria pilin [Serratia fonticola]|uniref:Type 1 fimbria pilin n=1 Tax=Serratia fonticola TaxID=47917 RepID=A0A542CY20_SERFO|nr:fimbrial protein [Serratia fonticola]TQI82262.1 type 1 fimbria pilin [Serratia fonticola]TQI95718.1 type 1 fimbria pilin [Serratia fonticola]TVZ70214.1 type 1 fimbria pilin [Serratia fonticola]
MARVNNRLQWASGFGVLILMAASFACAQDNMRFYGALVAEPCVIPPGKETITLDFGTVVDKYLYQHQRTLGQRFELHLAQCDLSLAKRVKVSFTGVPNMALPGMLALDGGSEAQGIAIGLETLDAKRLPIDEPSEQYGLLAGSNIIVLRAFIQGEPKALMDRTIKRGSFAGTATFTLEYE